MEAALTFTQAEAVIIAAVITGVFAIIGALIARSTKGVAGSEGRDPVMSIFLIATVTVCAVMMFSFAIGIIGIVYGNAELKNAGAAVGMGTAIGLYILVAAAAQR